MLLLELFYESFGVPGAVFIALIVGLSVAAFAIVGCKRIGILAALLVCMIASAAEACPRCRVATCYGCNYVAPKVAGYSAPYVQHEDGTWWLNGIEYKIGKKYCGTSDTGFCIAWYPVSKGGAPAQVPVPFAAQGTTAYGYSQTSTYGNQTLSNLTSAYQTDPALFMNQAFRLQSSAQDHAAKGYTTFASLAADLTGQQQDNARIVATGQAFAAALQASSPSQTTRSFNATQTSGQPAQVSAQSLTVLSPALTQSAQNRCAGCHTGDTNKSQFDLNNLAALSVEGFDRVLARLDSQDPEKRMPRQDNGPGEPLPLAEKSAWFAHRAKITQ